MAVDLGKAAKRGIRGALRAAAAERIMLWAVLAPASPTHIEASMRSRYFVTYDISDDDRRTAVYKALRGFGDHLQFSVFRCDLSDLQRATMIATLDPLIDHVDDQVLVIDLGPVDGRAATCVFSLGKPYSNPERRVIIV